MLSRDNIFLRLDWVKNIPWRLHLIVSSIGVLIVATMSYGFYHGNELVEKYAPLIDAAMEIKLEATIAHLGFEEIIKDDSVENINIARQHLDNAQWYATAMLKGGVNLEGNYSPVEDAVLREEIEIISQKIDLFRNITDQRYEAIINSLPDTIIDQQHDGVFDDFINQVDRVESKIQAEIREETKFLKIVQVMLAIISLLSIVVIVGVINYFERRRIQDIKLISEANNDLKNALEEVKVLQGIIPICSYCKKIRNDKGLWDQMEIYIHDHSAAQFSHGVCPECYKKVMEQGRKRE